MKNPLPSPAERGDALLTFGQHCLVTATTPRTETVRGHVICSKEFERLSRYRRDSSSTTCW